MPAEPTRPTRWNVVLLSVAAGIAGACLIGKVPPSLPTLRAEIGLDLVEAGWLASLMNTLGALFGIVVGSAIDRIGRRSALIGALAVMAIGSVFAAFAQSVPALFFSRLIEGFGFVVTVVAAPSVIVEATARADQRFVFGLWGTYVPCGIAIAMVLAPLGLSAFGWQGVSLAAAAPALLIAAWLAFALVGTPDTAVPARRFNDIAEVLRTRGPWLLGTTFSFYAFQWFIVMTWLPTLLIETMGYDAGEAGRLTAVIVFVNALGNIFGGALLSRGAHGWFLIATVGLIQGTTIQVAFAESLSEVLRYSAVLAFSFFGGMLPASVFASIPALTPRFALIGLVNGLIVQCSNLGSVLGPPVYAAIVLQFGGWDQGAFVLLGASTLVFALALSLRPLETRS